MSQPEDDSDRPRFGGPGALDRALALVRFLRRECPWDQAQTAESLIPHLLEETHEVVDAIREGDAEALEGELGDLLLNLAFQVVVAEERGGLDAESVYRRLERKMIARHPHLFEGGERRSWEEMKAAEREAGTGVLDGLAKGLDPLTKAYRIQERVAGVGFDWEDWRGPAEKVAEELEETRAALEGAQGAAARADTRNARPAEANAPDADRSVDAVTEELGDLLFAVVNLSRLAGVHPTTALARANSKFHARFERLEALAVERGIDMPTAGLVALDALWDEVKREG